MPRLHFYHASTRCQDRQNRHTDHPSPTLPPHVSSSFPRKRESISLSPQRPNLIRAILCIQAKFSRAAPVFGGLVFLDPRGMTQWLRERGSTDLANQETWGRTSSVNRAIWPIWSGDANLTMK